MIRSAVDAAVLAYVVWCGAAQMSVGEVLNGPLSGLSSAADLAESLFPLGFVVWALALPAGLYFFGRTLVSLAVGTAALAGARRLQAHRTSRSA